MPEEVDPALRRAERRRLAVYGVVVTLALSAAVVWLEQRQADKGPPREVQKIAAGLRAVGHSVDRIARNANGGWSVLFDDGEVQWFKGTTHAEAENHPIRAMYAAQHDVNVRIEELHPTVFAIVLSGRRQGSTLELGTAPTSAETIAAAVQTAVHGPSRPR